MCVSATLKMQVALKLTHLAGIVHSPEKGLNTYMHNILYMALLPRSLPPAPKIVGSIDPKHTLRRRQQNCFLRTPPSPHRSYQWVCPEGPPRGGHKAGGAPRYRVHVGHPVPPPWFLQDFCTLVFFVFIYCLSFASESFKLNLAPLDQEEGLLLTHIFYSRWGQK